MKPQELDPIAAFIIGKTLYQLAEEEGQDSILYNQAEGWISIMEACMKLGQWLDTQGSARIDFEKSSYSWVFWWDEIEHVRPIYESIPHPDPAKWTPEQIETLFGYLREEFEVIDEEES